MRSEERQDEAACSPEEPLADLALDRDLGRADLLPRGARGAAAARQRRRVRVGRRRVGAALVAELGAGVELGVALAALRGLSAQEKAL